MRRSAVPTKLLPRASRRPKKVKGPALVTSDEFVGDDWLAVDEPRTKRKRPNSDVTYFTYVHEYIIACEVILKHQNEAFYVT